MKPDAPVHIDELRLVGSPQTSKVMHAELIRITTRALGRRPPDPRKEGSGQLVYPWDPEIAYVAAVFARTPTRVVRDLYRSSADRLEPLYAELRAAITADPRLWNGGLRRFSLEARRVADFAAGERQVVGTVKNALIDGMGARGQALSVDAEAPEMLLVVRMDDRNELVVSLDLLGGSLTQRGWRRQAGEAPIREHLAAVLLMLARYDARADVLVDPVCGSGTIPIEAALAARAVPRVLSRSSLRLLAAAGDAAGFQALLVKGKQPLFADTAPIIIGQDVDVAALVDAKANAQDAEVSAAITWRRADARRLDPEEIAVLVRERGGSMSRGLILGNPPYGERLGDTDELMAFTAELAVACRRFHGWRAAFISAHPGFERAFAREPAMKKPLANGNLRAYFFLYEF
jgi:23S rRNA G2445 N2-methylase RlmL